MIMAKASEIRYANIVSAAQWEWAGKGMLD